ncbi:ABC transporter substrate-binding protein [Massilia sp. Root351]|jgi:polar amino acid transport system substrate-binding protein|uniref:substrate-binding periplasmic protein n=1 Tax=Massilia sp. Root351 TaxID=1736522 RepID=UPI000A97FF14|nr:transporter substrate-binding domain-containing protein [Massilia sp. Root351]
MSLPILALVAATLLPQPASAGCSRAIRVPASPTGYSVIVQGNSVSGVIPDTLRELGAKAGCTFEFPVMPRARMAFQFLESGQADLMVPASRSADRDLRATFVPMMKWKVELISLKARKLAAHSVQALLAQKNLRGVVVRSYSFGDEYDALLRQLEAERRIDYADDLASVGRLLKAGRADFTVMAPAIFMSSLNADPAAQALLAQLAYQPLAGLPMTESGAYVSRRSLQAADQRALHALLNEASRGVLWRYFQQYYPPDMLRFAVVPH